MAVPKNKTSKARRDKRRATHKIFAPTMVKCPKCAAFIKPHHMCSECGYYDGKEVIKAEA